MNIQEKQLSEVFFVYTVQSPVETVKVYVLRGDSDNRMTATSQNLWFWEPADYDGGEGFWSVGYPSKELALQAALDAFEAYGSAFQQTESFPDLDAFNANE